MKLGPFTFKRIYGDEDLPGYLPADGVRLWSPYLTKVGVGRLFLHVFHRGDGDRDLHDHPWDFWTFPLVSYVEEVAVYPCGTACCEICDEADDGCRYCSLAGEPLEPRVGTNVVEAWRLHHRKATYQHRVLAPLSGYLADGTPTMRRGPIVTLVWYGRKSRAWGFLKNRAGKWCWQDWKQYGAEGGKDAGCD